MEDHSTSCCLKRRIRRKKKMESPLHDSRCVLPRRHDHQELQGETIGTGSLQRQPILRRITESIQILSHSISPMVCFVDLLSFSCLGEFSLWWTSSSPFLVAISFCQWALLSRWLRFHAKYSQRCSQNPAYTHCEHLLLLFRCGWASRWRGNISKAWI